MNNKIKFSIYLIAAVIISFGLSISIQSLIAAWEAPTLDPPDGNMPRPIHVGSEVQTKAGLLGLQDTYEGWLSLYLDAGMQFWGMMSGGDQEFLVYPDAKDVYGDIVLPYEGDTYTRTFSDSFATNELGAGTLIFEGTAIDASSTQATALSAPHKILIGSGLAGKHSTNESGIFYSIGYPDGIY